MVRVAGRDATGAVARGMNGIFLPLLPPASAWPERARTWIEIRPVADTAGRAVGLAKLIASRENMMVVIV